MRCFETRPPLGLSGSAILTLRAAFGSHSKPASARCKPLTPSGSLEHVAAAREAAERAVLAQPKRAAPARPTIVDAEIITDPPKLPAADLPARIRSIAASANKRDDHPRIIEEVVEHVVKIHEPHGFNGEDEDLLISLDNAQRDHGDA